jgi:hypothetical protein
MCHGLSREAPTRGLPLIMCMLVYGLYGLTGEEIVIVEGRLKHEWRE